MRRAAPIEAEAWRMPAMPAAGHRAPETFAEVDKQRRDAGGGENECRKGERHPETGSRSKEEERRHSGRHGCQREHRQECNHVPEGEHSGGSITGWSARQADVDAHGEKGDQNGGSVAGEDQADPGSWSRRHSDRVMKMLNGFSK